MAIDAELAATLGKAGGVAALGISAIGSSIGIGLAGSSAIGAWKKAYAQGKSALFTLLVFAGAPMSQTIYGMILLIFINDAVEKNPQNWAAYLGAGIFGGLGMATSSWFQGKAGAAAADALSETGKGFANYLMILGVVETISLFVLVFSRLAF
ncbi:ATP synthase subunit K [Fibrobacterales bacterium]|nr:ATP synthase subunit K [Fibrobacterales bacterium]